MSAVRREQRRQPAVRMIAVVLRHHGNTAAGTLQAQSPQRERAGARHLEPGGGAPYAGIRRPPIGRAAAHEQLTAQIGHLRVQQAQAPFLVGRGPLQRGEHHAAGGQSRRRLHHGRVGHNSHAIKFVGLDPDTFRLAVRYLAQNGPR